MLGFSQLSKPIKWQDLLEKGKNGRKASRTGAKIHFSEKIFWGYRHFNLQTSTLDSSSLAQEKKAFSDSGVVLPMQTP